MKVVHGLTFARFGALALAVMSVASIRSADAAIVNTVGNVLIVAPPPNVVLTTFEDDKVVRLFREQSSLELPTAITADVTKPGIVGAAADLSRAQLAAGTRVDSYLLHADPLSFGRPIRVYQGSVTFDRPILGAMMTYESLTSTDALLGSATTNYIPPEIFRGFEGLGFPESSVPVRDTLEISADFHTLSFLFRTESRMDQIRVVTVANPEPSTAVLAVIVATFGAFCRRW